MVAFEHQGVATVEHVDNMRRDRPTVSQHAQAADSIVEQILNRLPCIVRNREGEHLNILDTQAGMTVDQNAFRLKTAATLCSDLRPVRKVDRNFETGGKLPHSGKVIAVFMRHQNAGNFFWGNR